MTAFDSTKERQPASKQDPIDKGWDGSAGFSRHDVEQVGGSGFDFSLDNEGYRKYVQSGC